MRRFRLGGVAAAVSLALLLAACGGNKNALSGGGNQNTPSSITIGSTNFSEQLILAQMYAAVLKKAGVDVKTRLNLGAREVVFPALEKGDIDLLPEYTGAALSFLDPKSTATTAAQVNAALQQQLASKNLVALDPTPAEDKDAWAVTRATADKEHLQKISDLKPVAGQLVVGGPPELKTRPAGLPGLKKLYGITFKEFKPLDAGGPLTFSALKKGSVQVARVFSTQGRIATDNLVVLQEDKLLEPAQNLVPIGRKDALSDSKVTQALNALSAKITTEELTKLNAQVDVEKKDPEQVARDWLQQNGLA
ncbi:MAG TPA: ABC transporter substrate-binding protein [Actinomycetes bacterium]|nr:ABC transporter substrate-binding protein [Actinomycetes bacterium]